MKPFAWTPADGKPTTPSPASIVEPSSGSSTTPTHVPGEVELAVAVDAGQLGRLAADERDARFAADLRRPFDELCHLGEIDLRSGDVVEEDERLGARRDHVVDAVRREVGAAGAQRAAPPREDELRPDAVGRGREEAADRRADGARRTVRIPSRRSTRPRREGARRPRLPS